MALDRSPSPIIVKVGGSLFDLPDLGPRLARWLEPHHPVLLIPGGGATTDVIRALDRCHQLGEERSHWLALRALALNAHFLAALLPHAAVVETVEACPPLWRTGKVPVLDTFAFAHADEGQPGCLPHHWDVTSDSVAARVARMVHARRLVLLKSVGIAEGTTRAETVREGKIDPCFAAAAGPELEVEWVNFRAWNCA